MIDEEYEKQVRQVKQRIKDIREMGDELDLDDVEDTVMERVEELRQMLDLGGGDVFLVAEDAEGVDVSDFGIGRKKKKKRGE